MNNFAFNPAQGFKDASAYPNPSNETETREQLMSLHEQTRDFINANLTDAVTSDTVVKIRATGAGFSYSTDGTNYTTIEGSSSGQGDMYTSVYDTNANGIVDNAERVNGHTVLKDVPANAVFTDTVYNANRSFTKIGSSLNPSGGTITLPTNYSEYLFKLNGTLVGGSNFIDIKTVPYAAFAILTSFSDVYVTLSNRADAGASGNYYWVGFDVSKNNQNRYVLTFSRNQSGYGTNSIEVYGR